MSREGFRLNDIPDVAHAKRSPLCEGSSGADSANRALNSS
jgi:hypothetical protein